MTYDPNFPNRNPDPEMTPPNRGWTLGIGVAIVLAIIAFLATGKQHSGDQAANAPPSANSTMAPAPGPTAGASTLPAPRAPTETTGTAPRQ